MSSILLKNELENSNFSSSLLGQKFFVRFLEELNTQKRPLEEATKVLNLILVRDSEFLQSFNLLRSIFVLKKYL